MGQDEGTPESGDAPIIDWDAARRGIPGGAKGIQELAVMMQEESARLMEEIRQGLESGSAPRVKLAAHTLRGGVLHFGAGAVVEATTEMHSLAAAEALDEARAACPGLEALVARLVEELGHADRHTAEDAP